MEEEDIDGNEADGPRAFLDRYILCEMLGQGAFGIVYACRPIRNYDTKQAVKMVDKVEAPADQIQREGEVQRKLQHPNIVKVHDIFDEPCFVCIVMDLCRGGDLIECLEGRAKGGVSCSEVMHVPRQMIAAIQCLHHQEVVHRDVKGDNFMLDPSSDLVDPTTRILLTDFGTACPLPKGQRLSEAVGTHSYWSPEVYDGDYGHKADIWALGVVMHGLYDGNMPFRGQREAREKEVHLSPGTPSACEDFVRALLCRDEPGRPSADEALEHPWLSYRGQPGERARPRVGEPSSLREVGAHPVVADRRGELVSRMRSAARTKTGENGYVSARRSMHVQSTPSCLDLPQVSTTHTDGSKSTYEWWAQGSAEVKGVKYVDTATEATISDADCNISATLVGQMLTSYGISMEGWGQGESSTLQLFADEVARGTARLMLDATEHKKMVRVVDLVKLRIVLEGGEQRKLLVEYGQVYPDGRVVASLDRLPGAKRMSHENTRQVAERVLTQQLNLAPGMVSFDYRHPEVFEQKKDSRAYPGVSTVYKTEIVKGFITNLDHPAMVHARNINFRDSFCVTRRFGWWTLEDCETKGVSIFPPPDSRTHISGLVPAPVATDEQELRRLLGAEQLDEEGVKRLAIELIKGESRLVRKPDGRLLRVVELVVLKLVKGWSGDIMVEVCCEAPRGGGLVEVKRLPAGKRRPDENPFWCANRILTSMLKIDDNCVCFDKDNVPVVEEQVASSTSLPGLPTVYRKHVITGLIRQPKDDEDATSGTLDFDVASARMRNLSAWRATSFCDDGDGEGVPSQLQPIPPTPPMSPTAEEYEAATSFSKFAKGAEADREGKPGLCSSQASQLLYHLFNKLAAKNSGAVRNSDLMQVLDTLVSAGESSELLVGRSVSRRGPGPEQSDNLVSYVEFVQSTASFEDILGRRLFSQVISGMR